MESIELSVLSAHPLQSVFYGRGFVETLRDTFILSSLQKIEGAEAPSSIHADIALFNF